MSSTLLAIETATEICSVAVFIDGRPRVELNLSRPRAHAEFLAPLIGDALRYTECEPSQIDVISVSAGPGSYTGLRIGVSTAKGLALAVDAKLVAVPSLEAQAARLLDVAAPGDVICAAFNSRRDELYLAVYRVESRMTLRLTREPAVVSQADLKTWLPVPDDHCMWIAGEGADRISSNMEPAANIRIMQRDSAVNVPSASFVARMALPRIAANHFEDVSSFEPAYLKEFVALKPTRSAFDRLSF